MSEMGAWLVDDDEAIGRFTKWLTAHDERLRRAVAWEAITAVHDHLDDAALCEPIEAHLERHFGFVQARESSETD